MIARLGGAALVAITRLLVGARARWFAPPPAGACVYFANHTSHLDTVAIWSALSPAQRRGVRPVAARDYWSRPGLRSWIAGPVLHAILIDRNRETPDADPLAPVRAAIDAGAAVVLFPEGTRNSERLPQKFRGGLFKLAQAYPALPLVPVYLDTLHRSLPKGARLPLPLPLYCTVNFGPALARIDGEDRDAFLERARMAVEAMA